jgi:acetyl esterase/lipase
MIAEQQVRDRPWLSVFVLIVTLITPHSSAFAQIPVLLWPEPPPHSAGVGEGHTPTLTPCLPDPSKHTGLGIVVCPGGGYGHLALDHEGAQIAAWLNDNGIAAFVLRYRHAPNYQHPVPMLDVQRALRTTRHRAKEWGIDPAKLGVIGFSAGGHLAATASTQFDNADPNASDPVDQASSRPDFTILLYPVITMRDPDAHAGSRNNLLGESPSEERLHEMSANERVTAETPPAFLVHTHEDQVVPASNAVLYYSALLRAGVPAELHIFERGPHGLGLARRTEQMHAWPELCLTWLRIRGFLP